MSKPRTKSNTYLPLRGYNYSPWPFKYTENEKKKIVLLFKNENRESAIQETLEHVAILISCLRSEGTPQNVKKSEEIKRLRKIYKGLCSLDDITDRTKSCDPVILELKKVYHRLTKINISDLIDGIGYIKLACEYRLKNPTKRAGVKNPHYYLAVQKLAEIWNRYNKKPTRRYNEVKSKTYGPFLDYLNSAINLPIIRLNKEIKKYNKQLKKREDLKDKILRKEIPSCPSLYNIAKNIIRKLYPETMAKILSK